MDNLIDHERNAARNTSINPEVKINIGEVRNFEDPKNLLDNVVGAGDGNRNTVLLQKTLTHDFIKHETDNSDSKGAKRKRDESPESYTDLLDDDEAADEESMASGLESDVEDNDSETELKEPPEPVITELSYDATIDKNLPDTVTLLTTPEGSKVYLVGTAHFSKESQEDVAKIIRAVQPHFVLVELCKARVSILLRDEETILEEAKNINFEKIRATIKQTSLTHGLLYILLLKMSAHLTKQLGMAPGGEFRRAFEEAQKVPKCIVQLGDRPIHVTLQRALSALSWWQTICLIWQLLTSREPISKEEVEKCKQRDLLEEMMAEMTGDFPGLSTVFVNERDMYLTHSLQLVATIQPDKGSYPTRIVGVVGIGHVPGIVQNWGKVTQEDIPPIMRVPPPTLSGRIITLSFKASVVGLLIWGCTKILPINSIKSSVVNLIK